MGGLSYKAMKFLTFLICLVAGASTVAAADAKPEIRVIEEIVAKVNGDIITRGDLTRARSQLDEALRARGAGTPEQLQKALQQRSADLLREKIDDLLLVQKANQLSINVDAEVSKYLADLQLKAKIPDPEKFHDWIRQQSGQTFEDFRQDVKNNMLKSRVVHQEIGRSINISKAEAEKYYNAHKNEFIREERVFLREILVSTENKDAAGVAAAEKKAKDLVARARRGEKFGDLARDNSDSPSAQQGGDLQQGYKKDELNEALVKLIWDQPRNYVTDPIKMPNGFLILKVEEHHKAGLANFEEVQDEISNKLYMPRFEPKIREYMTRLRQEAFLEIREGFVDTGAAPGKDTRWQDPAQLRPETVTKEEVAARVHKKRLLWMVPVGTIDADTQSRSQAGR